MATKKQKNKKTKNSQFNKEDIYEKIKFFSKRRYDFVLVLFSLALIYIVISLNSTLDLVKIKDKQIEKANSYATYITDSGIIKQYQRETFNVSNERNNVANILSKYLVQSAFDITNEYKISSFSSADSLYKSYKPFQEFYVNFLRINSETASKEELEGYEKVKGDWKQILKWFKFAINDNDLPQIIDKKTADIDITAWNTKKNKFTIIFTFPIYSTSRNSNGAIDEGVSLAFIQASGYYNLMDKTVLNPYGMKFTSLQLVHPQIDNHKTKKK